MNFIELRKQVEENFKIKKVDENNFIIYLPFFFQDDKENFPLVLHEDENCVILTDLGKLSDKLFEDDKDYQENKKEIIEILNDFGMELNKGNMELQCEADDVFMKISTYLQALSVINYLFE